MAYTLTGEKCGTVRLDPATTGVVINESVQRSSKVTSNPIENGADINDHVVTDPVKFTINGITINGDGQEEILRRMWQQKDILTYVGRNRIPNCVITSYKSDNSAKNANGSSFSITLQVINITSSEYVETGDMMMSAQDADASSTESAAQTKATKAEGLKTAALQTISSSAYADYVNSYAKKASSSDGPTSRSTASYSAA